MAGQRGCLACQVHAPWLLCAALLRLSDGSSFGALEPGSGHIVAEIDASASVSRTFPRLARAGGAHERRFAEPRNDKTGSDVEAHPSPSLSSLPLGSYVQTDEASAVEAKDDESDCPQATIHSELGDVFFVLPSKSVAKVTFGDSFHLKRSENCDGKPESNSVFVVQSVSHLDAWQEARVVLAISNPLPQGTFYVCMGPRAGVSSSSSSSVSALQEEEEGEGMKEWTPTSRPSVAEVEVKTSSKQCLARITYEGTAAQLGLTLVHKLLEQGVGGTALQALKRSTETEVSLQTQLACLLVVLAVTIWIAAALLTLKGLSGTWSNPRSLDEEEPLETPCIRPFPLGERTRGSFIQMFSFVMGNVGLVGVALRCMFIDVQPWLLDTILILDAFVGCLGLLLLARELYVQQLYDIVAGQGRCLLDHGGISFAEASLVSGFATMCVCLVWGWKQLEDRATLFGISSGFLAVFMAILRLWQTRQKRANGLCEVSLPELTELLMSSSSSSSSSSSKEFSSGKSPGTLGDEAAQVDDTEGRLKLLHERIGVPLHIGSFCKHAREGADPLLQEDVSSTGHFGLRDTLWQPRYIYETTGSRWAFSNLIVIMGMYVLLLLNLAELKLYFQVLTPEVQEFKSSQGILVPSFSPDIRKYNFLYDSLGQRNGTKSFSFFTRGMEDTVRKQHFRVGEKVQSINASDLVRLTDIGGRHNLEVDVEAESGKNGLTTNYDFSFLEVTYHIGTILIKSNGIDGTIWKQCRVWDSSTRLVYTFNGAIHLVQEWEIRVFPYVRGVPIKLSDVPEDGREVITVVHPLEDAEDDQEAASMEVRCQQACWSMQTCKTFEATEKGCFLGVLPSHKTSLTQDECIALHAAGIPQPSRGSPLESLLNSRQSLWRLCKAHPEDGEEPCVMNATDGDSGSLTYNFKVPIGTYRDLTVRFDWLLLDKTMQAPAVVASWEILPSQHMPFPDFLVATSHEAVRLSIQPAKRPNDAGYVVVDYRLEELLLPSDIDILIVMLGVDTWVDYSLDFVGPVSGRKWKTEDFKQFHLGKPCREDARYRQLSVCNPKLTGEPTDTYHIFTVDKWSPGSSETLTLGGAFNAKAQGVLQYKLSPYFLKVKYGSHLPPSAMALSRRCTTVLPGTRGARFSSVLQIEAIMEGAEHCLEGVDLRVEHRGCPFIWTSSYRDFLVLGLLLHQAPQHQIMLLEIASKAGRLAGTEIIHLKHFTTTGCEGMRLGPIFPPAEISALRVASGARCIPWSSFVIYGHLAPSIWTSVLPKFWPVLPHIVPELGRKAIPAQPATVLISWMRSLFDLENWGPKAREHVFEAIGIAIQSQQFEVLELLLGSSEAWSFQGREGIAAYDSWIQLSLSTGCQRCVQVFISKCEAASTGNKTTTTTNTTTGDSSLAGTCQRWMDGSRSHHLSTTIQGCPSDAALAEQAWKCLQVWWNATKAYNSLSLTPFVSEYGSAKEEVWDQVAQLDGLEFLDIQFTDHSMWNNTAMLPWVPTMHRIRFQNVFFDAPTVAEFVNMIEPTAKILTSISLNYAGLGADGVEALGKSPILERLKLLDLSMNPGLGTKGLKAALSLANLGSKVDFSQSKSTKKSAFLESSGSLAMLREVLEHKDGEEDEDEEGEEKRKTESKRKSSDEQEQDSKEERIHTKSVSDTSYNNGNIIISSISRSDDEGGDGMLLQVGHDEAIAVTRQASENAAENAEEEEGQHEEEEKEEEENEGRRASEEEEEEQQTKQQNKQQKKKEQEETQEDTDDEFSGDEEGLTLRLAHIGLKKDSFDDVSDSKLLRRLYHFDISINDEVGIDGLRKLFALLEQSSVRKLSLRNMRLKKSDMEEIGSLPFMGKLKYLDLSSNKGDGWEGTLALCKFPSTVTIRISQPGPLVSDLSLLDKFQDCKPGLYIQHEKVEGPNWSESKVFRKFIRN